MYFDMEGYRGRPRSPVCFICGDNPGVNGLIPDALCPACGRMLDWFRGYYTGERLDLGTITTETRFLHLMADSLDYGVDQDGQGLRAAVDVPMAMVSRGWR